MAQILGVGIATLDIINTVSSFPAEDSEVRAISQRICRGGNCTNTLTVLSQLQHSCSWSGTLAAEPDARRIVDELQNYQIDSRYAVTHAQGKVPTSYITLNNSNGSRTIVHYRDLEELEMSAFQAIPLEQFDWVHFEGRNIEQTVLMMQHLKQSHPAIPCSLEVEKQRDNIEQLFVYADVIIFSRAYCLSQGYNTAQEFVAALDQSCKQKTVIIAWGEQGSYGFENNRPLVFSPAVKLDTVTDTLGAGDTFNAGVIDAIVAGCDLQQTLNRANHLAAFKCGRHGFNLQDFEFTTLNNCEHE